MSNERNFYVCFTQTGTYIIKITEQEMNALENGELDWTEFLDECQENGRAVWKNGSLDMH